MAKKDETRGIRDEMNVGPDPRQARHLRPLRELGKFRVAEGEPDVRGWAVYSSTGRELGEVHELLVDMDAGEVVMLDVDLKRNDRHTLAPVRAAWIDHASRRVIINAAEVDGVDSVPSLVRGTAMSDDDARQFDEGYARAYAAHEDDREYRVRHGDEELRFNRRRTDPDVAATDHVADREVPVDRGDVPLADRRAADMPAASPDVPRRSRYVERYPLERPDDYRADEAREGLVRYRRREDDRLDR